MDLVITASPEVRQRVGVEHLPSMAHPSGLTIRTTGPGASTILMDGPAPGKTWAVTVRVDIVELDDT